MKPVTLVITTGQCTVRVHGLRAPKGWNIHRVDGARQDFQGHAKSKKHAIRLALDCCEPDSPPATYRVHPAS